MKKLFLNSCRLHCDLSLRCLARFARRFASSSDVYRAGTLPVLAATTLAVIVNAVPGALAQPIVTTLPASGVTASNATLNGTITPGGLNTFAYFQYGLTTNYGDIGEFTNLPTTNTTLTMPGLLVGSITDTAGATWTLSSAPTTNWASIASSAGGTQLAAVMSPGGIYTSTNAGVTWTQSSAPATNWQTIASSADGTTLAAGVDNGGIYYSSNSGMTWTQSNAQIDHWRSLASSADGTHMAAALLSGGIYTSTNSGVTWTQSGAPESIWMSVASSADGSRLAACINGGGIYTSTNSGSTWTLSGATNAVWYSIALSADGKRLAAVVGNGGEKIYTSTNGGSTWTLSSSPAADWYSIVSSADGTRLAASAFSPNIYLSTNGGTTWTSSALPGPNALASSADGTRLAATQYGFGIYTSTGAVSALVPGTTGHYRLVGFNSAGTSLGSDLTFTNPLSAPYSLAVLADHPIGYWRLNETNSSVANDYFGANSGFYTNALLGQPGYTNLDPHTAVKFGSISNFNSYVGGVPIDFATAGNATFSIECWANGGAQTNDSGIITRGTGGGEQFNLDCGATSHAFRFFVRNAGGAALVANGDVVPDNNWHHLVGVCDQPNGKVILYVDGSSNATGVIAPGTGIFSSANPTTFGSRQSSTGAYNLQFAGSLEEVAIYPNALSAARVLAHYQAATTPLPPVITSATVLSNGAFQLTFANPNNFVFSVLGTTNLSLPASNWTVLGTATNIGGILNGFTDSQATNDFGNRYYRLRFP